MSKPCQISPLGVCLHCGLDAGSAIGCPVPEREWERETPGAIAGVALPAATLSPVDERSLWAASFKGKIARLESEVACLTDRLALSQARCAGLEVENARLKKQLSSAGGRNVRDAIKVLELCDENAALRAEIAALTRPSPAPDPGPAPIFRAIRQG